MPQGMFVMMLRNLWNDEWPVTHAGDVTDIQNRKNISAKYLITKDRLISTTWIKKKTFLSQNCICKSYYLEDFEACTNSFDNECTLYNVCIIYIWHYIGVLIPNFWLMFHYALMRSWRMTKILSTIIHSL